MNLLIFSIGAAFGAPIRFWLDNKFRQLYRFPVGIFIVNIVGAFVIGLYATHMNYFVVGFCGALTTWSTFIIDFYQAFSEKQSKSALVNLFGSIFLGIVAFKLGINLH